MGKLQADWKAISGTIVTFAGIAAAYAPLLQNYKWGSSVLIVAGAILGLAGKVGPTAPKQ